MDKKKKDKFKVISLSEYLAKVPIDSTSKFKDALSLVENEFNVIRSYEHKGDLLLVVEA